MNLALRQQSRARGSGRGDLLFRPILESLEDRILLSATYQQTILGDNPVAYWRLGESSPLQPAASLVGGAALNGTYTSVAGADLGRPGAVGEDPDTSVHFNRSASASVHGGGIVPSYFSGQWTIEAWINHADQGSVFQCRPAPGLHLGAGNNNLFLEGTKIERWE